MLDRQKLDPVLYRDAMSQYAGHVQIVTTAHEGGRRGVTVTAACSVSDNPASVLVCLNNGNPSNRIFFESGVFALNTLAARHQSLADAFSGREKLESEERFARAEWIVRESGAPVLKDPLVAFDCRLTDMKSFATHTVLFGEVLDVHFGEKDKALIYLDRGYRTL